MKTMRFGLIGVLAALSMVASGCCGAPKPAATTVSIHGVVRFDDVPPRRKTIDVKADPAIAKARGDKPLLDSALIVADDGGLADTLVYVSAGLHEQTFAPPAEPAVFEIIGGEYDPHVQAIVAGQAVRFINRDNTLHNVHCPAAFNRQFNFALPQTNQVCDFIFGKPELGISIRCDVHPWESAVLHVMKNPFFAVTRADGSFEIKGLPPGEYELTAIHANKSLVADVSVKKVRVTADQGAEAAFTFRIVQPR